MSEPKRPKPPVRTELVWAEGVRFGVKTSHNALVLDGDGTDGASPMELVAAGIAGCMAVDVLSILQKGRHALTGLRVTFVGERLPVPPRRFIAVSLHFHVHGSVPPEAVQRAIDLSRDKYCSAWSSMRPDITFTAAYTIVA